MDWAKNLLNGENGTAVQLIAISIGLVILLIFIFWLFKKIVGRSAPKTETPDVDRLSITDSARVDETRYLVLVKRDEVEHLVMIGGPSDIVIETGISSNKSIAATVEKTNPEQEDAKPEEHSTSTVEKISLAGTTVAAGTVVSSTNNDLTTKTQDTEVSVPNLEESISAGLSEDLSAETKSESAEAVDITASNGTIPLNQPANLEAEISEKLDTVLSDETIEIASVDAIKEDMSEIPVSVPSQSADEIKTEMQKLLDEVAGIKETS